MGRFTEETGSHDEREMTRLLPLKAKMQTLTRDDLLKVIAAGVNELTVIARAYYDAPDGHRRLQQINEAIHRLSGHLRALCDRCEFYTQSRADGIFEQFELLPEASFNRLIEVAA